MIFGRLFYAERGSIDLIRPILIHNFGLVPPKDDPFNRDAKELLVWEDSEGVGRYRVHFYPECKRGTYVYEGIQFKYWLNNRRKREIFELNPMERAIVAVRQYLKGEFFERELTRDISIDQILTD